MSSKRKKVSRREFLVRTVKTAAGVVAASTLASCATAPAAFKPNSRIIGANDRINIGVIGIRSQGKFHLTSYAKLPNVFVKTMCDVDENLFAKRARKVNSIQGLVPRTEYDMRRVFDDKDIDAVSIATPNHWHALAAIWACQAGKHVYVEKPCSHNVREGRKIIEAAERYKCFVQVGFQSRSHSNIQDAIKFIHDGGLGEVYMAKGLCHKPRPSIGRCPDGVGADCDYYVWGKKQVNYDSNYMNLVHYDDLWIGPAPARPFNYNRFHYNWHWHWDYGNGDNGNQGPHEYDIARWGLNKNEHPVKIHSTGGMYAYDCAQETPNTQSATYEYADGKILQFEVRGIFTNAEAEVKIGVLFFGSKGWLYLNSLGKTWKAYYGKDGEPGPGSQEADAAADPSKAAGSSKSTHIDNFIDALRSGKKADLNCDIETGHTSCALPLLGNISYLVGRKLTFDGSKEKIVGDSEANSMLTRKYRKPYVVPKRV